MKHDRSVMRRLVDVRLANLAQHTENLRLVVTNDGSTTVPINSLFHH